MNHQSSNCPPPYIPPRKAGGWSPLLRSGAPQPQWSPEDRLSYQASGPDRTGRDVPQRPRARRQQTGTGAFGAADTGPVGDGQRGSGARAGQCVDRQCSTSSARTWSACSTGPAAPTPCSNASTASKPRSPRRLDPRRFRGWTHSRAPPRGGPPGRVTGRIPA